MSFAACFIVTLLIGLSQAQSRCVPLRRCESVQWLIRHLDQLPADKRSSTVLEINRMQCGITERSEMKVFCPNTVTDELENLQVRMGGVFNQRSSISTDCVGSLKVTEIFCYFIY